MAYMFLGVIVLMLSVCKIFEQSSLTEPPPLIQDNQIIRKPLLSTIVYSFVAIKVPIVLVTVGKVAHSTIIYKLQVECFSCSFKSPKAPSSPRMPLEDLVNQ